MRRRLQALCTVQISHADISEFGHPCACPRLASTYIVRQATARQILNLGGTFPPSTLRIKVTLDQVGFQTCRSCGENRMIRSPGVSADASPSLESWKHRQGAIVHRHPAGWLWLQPCSYQRVTKDRGQTDEYILCSMLTMLLIEKLTKKKWILLTTPMWLAKSTPLTEDPMSR